MRPSGTLPWRCGPLALATAALACPLWAADPLGAPFDGPEDGSAAAPETAPAGPIEVALEARVQRTWKLHLPSESWAPAGKLLDFTGGLGRAYSTELAGTSLKVDTDGDGELDVTVEAPGGLVVLEGERTRHALRLRYGSGWEYSAGSLVRGEIDGTRIEIVDQNNDGRYDGIGEDALVIGRSRSACYLSEVIALGDELHTLEVAPDGSSLTLTPYAGPAGRLEVTTEATAKVRAAVFVSEDGRHSVNLATSEGAALVPAGRYRLHSGQLAFSGNQVGVRTGESEWVEVTPDAHGALHWGGPARAEFAFNRRVGELSFDPNAIWYYGKAGEEYVDWLPNGKSPRIEVREKLSGKELAEAYFPGST
ncbi:MAG: hypothetical protein ACYS26_16985 [Planctomycetota bacterium]|jgi:hypothetical protein